MVSRALLQILGARERATSISHKLGHAVVASAPPGWQLGVDLEQMRARDVLRLSAWMASDAEAAALAALPPDQALRHFYQLWTFKEAMIKARGQDFPADLKTNTLTIDAASGQWRMQTPGARGWSLRQFEAAPGWLLSVVWCAPAGEAADIVWHLESDGPATPFALMLACDDAVQR